MYKTSEYEITSIKKFKWIFRWLQIKMFFHVLAKWIIFIPLAVLITIYYNTKKTLGIHKVK